MVRIYGIYLSINSHKQIINYEKANRKNRKRSRNGSVIRILRVVLC